MKNSMKILIIGANGFLGKNLIARLVQWPDIEIYHYDVSGSTYLLERNLAECSFLFHFAAVHRPKDSMEFYRINDDFFEWILTKLKEYKNTCPVLLTSSIQATDNNDYGRSKLIAESLLKQHSEQTGAQAIIYRLTNTFGKWATPNHHSVVATFCYNINRDIPIAISNRNVLMHFYYVDDVIDSFCSQLGSNAPAAQDGITTLAPEMIYTIPLGELADHLFEFRKLQKNGQIPVFENEFQQRLYATYQSYQKE